METNKANTNEFVSQKHEHEAIIEDHNHCCLCGTKLNFKHKVDFYTLQVNEEAHCPSCQIQLKRREYTLQ